MSSTTRDEASVPPEHQTQVEEEQGQGGFRHGLLQAGRAAVHRIAQGIHWLAHWGPMKGQASFYGTSRRGDHSGDGFAGQKMANGKPMDPNALTCAHQHLPLGTHLRVTHDGKSIDVVVTDRGPYAHNRILDLSPAAARRLDLIQAGHGEVQLEVLSLPG